MGLRHRQLRYGTAFGVATFLVGWLITVLFTPSELFPGSPRWKVTLWMFLNAHFVPVSGLQVAGVGSTTQVDILQQVPSRRSLRVVPILLTALGGVLVVEALSYTTRHKYLIQNSSALLIGYLSAGVVAFVVSDARPAVSMLLVSVAVLGAAAYLGGRVTQRLTANVPVFAVTSLRGLVVVGLVLLLGGVVFVRSIAPFVVMSGVGVTIGGVLAWVARNVPEKR